MIFQFLGLIFLCSCNFLIPTPESNKNRKTVISHQAMHESFKNITIAQKSPFISEENFQKIMVVLTKLEKEEKKYLKLPAEAQEKYDQITDKIEELQKESPRSLSQIIRLERQAQRILKSK